MKKIATVLILSFGFNFVTIAQNASTEESNCYYKWAKKFDERGSEEIADGSYPDVIISFRSGSDADCFNGKCDVKAGRVTAMYLKMEDGSYETVKKKPKYDNVPLIITNGMSSPYLTIDGELINVLFIKKIKPKKASFQKAAEPTDD
jgi:hypothetical protein